MAKLCAMHGIWCSYFLFFLTTVAVCSINDYHLYKTDFPSHKIKNYFVGEQRLHRRDAHIESKDTHHLYYNTTITSDPEIGQSFWVDLKNNTKAKMVLSNSHRRTATINLSFEFPFYGHLIQNVTITTDGFIYTGDFVNSWLAAAQYIAPLMANFDVSISNASFVRYMDNGTALTVEWENVVLQDQLDEGEFTFQVTLHKNGDIVFVYKNVPFPIGNISVEHHPVKVGLSDGYVLDRIIFYIRKKTIYEYDRINLVNEEIKNWTVIYLTALPTCLQNQDCYSCISNVIPSFECYWCPNIKRCSSGIDRNRQAWLSNNCQMKQLNESICSESTTLTSTFSAPTTTPIAILTTTPTNTPTAIPVTASPHFTSNLFTFGRGRSNHFQCNNFSIPKSWICDGTNDCVHGEDEQGCDYNSRKPSCSKGYFSCDDDRCHPLAYICDGNNDCEDGYDEANCTEDSRTYQVLQMGNDSRNSNETSLLLHWFIVQPFDVRLEFLPSISRMWYEEWRNETWTTNFYHRFNNLEPGTIYNMTVYVRMQNTSREFVPAKYHVAQTHEAVIPGSPRNVTVTQFNQSHVILSWNPPVNPNSQIVNYQISWYPHKETKLKVSGKVTSHLLKANFEPEIEYSFYVTAHNRAHASDKSEVVSLRFNGVSEKSFQSEDTTAVFGVTEDTTADFGVTET